MSGFRSDYDWQLKFLETIKNIVGPLLLIPASFEEDAHEACDMLVLKARDMRIGCRVRRSGYSDLYPWEFTIRSRRDNGAETELNKIVNGWGDWMFYGHAANDGGAPAFSRWMVIDLAAWRAQQIRSRGIGRVAEMSNKGDGTHFEAFDVRRFKTAPEICIACSHVVPE